MAEGAAVTLRDRYEGGAPLLRRSTTAFAFRLPDARSASVQDGTDKGSRRTREEQAVIRISRAIAGGAVGSALFTSMMYFVAPVMTGRRMDIAAMLGSMMGNSWALGMMAHLANGIVVFPLIYAYGVYQRLPGAPWARGIVWGIVLWLLAQLVVLPAMGGGFFSAGAGGMRSVIPSLLGHLVYGLALGAVAGAPERTRSTDTRSAMSGGRA